ncbi:DUF222 domain-containing protein [Kutzneria sp. 744]|uniref:DUF222 domain-containing protein n=1 Tax=Kutzneria sp. (strain 744) TaxID=345341 RepID=UPI0003EEC724|nr:DUF222 domain-containing protein [Kutzneria sp. 744]EWM13103.1 hypothetical protein KUTG_03407 [Kutzneria sp. 744]
MQEPWNVSALLTKALSLTEGDRTDSELLETVRDLARLESTVRAALSHSVAVAIAQGVHERTGHATAAALLRNECHLSGREANELAVSAIRLREQLPCTFVALQSGAITWAHATTLVRAVDRLGFGTVQGIEHDWIELIATRTSPEALQRVVHTHCLELVGYPSRAASEPQGAELPPAPTNTADTQTETHSSAPEAASPSTAPQAHGSHDVDSSAQHEGAEATARPLPSDLGDRHRASAPEHNEGLQPAIAISPDWPDASTLPLSSDGSSIAHEDSATDGSGCMHPRCAAKASPREISFTVRWLDGGQSTLFGRALVCDEHTTALMNCPVDRIRVGHSSTIWTIGPAPVADAA